MDFISESGAQTCSEATFSADSANVRELDDLHLALVGGGIGDFVQ